MQKIISKINLIGSKTGIQFILFSSILWLVFVFLEINRHIKNMIIGLHYWRKSDTYSQISNYYYNGLNFFDHSLYYNQFESAGKAVGEFPIFYYFIALQQSIFGNYSMIAKVNWIVLLFAGLFAMFKIANHYLKHFALSSFVALSVFLSPVFTIYAIDYLPDPIAFNFMFIGLWFFLKFTISNRKTTLFWAFFFIGIAGMIKPFFLIPFIAILMTAVLNQIWLKTNFFKLRWTFLLPFIGVIGWFVYSNWYNQKVGANSFLLEPQPIWNSDAEKIETTRSAIINQWLPDYLHPIFLWCFLLLILTNLCWWTKKERLLTIFFLLCFVGCCSFVLLFFVMFEEHDYYIYPLIFMLPLTIGITIYRLSSIINWQFFKSSFACLILVFFFFGLKDSWKKTQARRMNAGADSTFQYENYQNVDNFLSKNGVTENTYVIAFSDKSPNFALSLMKRKGWSGYQTLNQFWDLSKPINLGADFLLINERAPKQSDSLRISGYLDYPIADTNGLFIYNLKPYREIEN